MSTVPDSQMHEAEADPIFFALLLGHILVMEVLG
jgi:hypothetical protein